MKRLTVEYLVCGCGCKVHKDAASCPQCGKPTECLRSKGKALLWAVTFGFMGAHQFYRGRREAGLVQLILGLGIPLAVFADIMRDSTSLMFVSLAVSSLWAFCSIVSIILTPPHKV